MNVKEHGEAAAKAKNTRNKKRSRAHRTPKEAEELGHRAKAKVEQHQNKTKRNGEKPAQVSSMTPEQGKKIESAQEHTAQAQTMLEGFAEFLHRRNWSFVLQQHPFAS